MFLLDAHSSNQENQGEESLDIFGLCCEVVDINLQGGRESAQPTQERGPLPSIPPPKRPADQWLGEGGGGLECMHSPNMGF